VNDRAGRCGVDEDLDASRGEHGPGGRRGKKIQGNETNFKKLTGEKTIDPGLAGEAELPIFEPSSQRKDQRGDSGL